MLAILRGGARSLAAIYMQAWKPYARGTRSTFGGWDSGTKGP